MTPLTHCRSTIYELRAEDEVVIGDFRYSVKRAVRGGMGLVFLLQKCAPGEWSLVVRSYLAIKTVLPEFLDQDSVKMFRRELAIWAGFRHSNILHLDAILDAGSDGWVAAMEWCPGSLRDQLKKLGKLSLSAATQVVCDILTGLTHAYESDKVIHLDLKPENIMYQGYCPRNRYWARPQCTK